MDTFIKFILIIIILMMVGAGLYGIAKHFNVNKADLQFKAALEKYKFGEPEDIKRGIEAFNDLIMKYPDSKYKLMAMYQVGQGYELLGQRLNAKDRYKTALQKYKKLVSQYSDTIWSKKSLLRIAHINTKYENYSEALKQLDSLLASFPDEQLKKDIFNEKGYIYYLMNNFHSAIQNFSQKENINDSRASYYRIKSLINIGETDRAINSMEDFILYHPDSKHKETVKALFLDHCYKYAHRNYKNNSLDVATTYFKRIIKNYPDTIEGEASLYWIAETYYDRERYSEAIEKFRKVLANEIYTKDADAQFKIAKSYYEKKDFIKSLKEFNEFIDKYYEKQKLLKEAKQWKTVITRSLKYSTP